MKIAIAQIAPSLGKIEENLEKHWDFIIRAKEMGASLVIFPELSLAGYELMDLVPDVALKSESNPMNSLKELSRELPFFAGFVLEERDLFYNASGFFRDGELVHVHRKVLLPNYSMFEEKRFFAEGDKFEAFDTDFGRIGVLICYDYLHPSTSYLYFLQQVDLLVVQSAAPARGIQEDGFSSLQMWDNMSRVVSKFFTTYVAYVNRVGFDGGMGFAGGSHAYGPTGTKLVQLAELDEDLNIFEYSREEVRRARILFPAYRDERPEVIFKEMRRILNED